MSKQDETDELELCDVCKERPGLYIHKEKLLCACCEHAIIHKEYFESGESIYKKFKKEN